jgi:predicted dehydrogenase
VDQFLKHDYKVLIVGSGSIGLRHQDVLKQHFPNAKAVFLTRKRKPEIDEDIYKNLENINDAKRFDPEIVVVANPSPWHLQSAKEWIGSCQAILIEKPLSRNLTECLDFYKETKKLNVPILVGYNLRFLSSLNEFKKLFGEGITGKTYSIRIEVGQYLPNWRPGTDYSQSVSAQAELGGGALLELSHEIDYLRWIFGDFNWVFGIMERSGSLDIDVEDMVQVLFSIKTQQYGHVVGSFQLDFLRQDRSRKCEVIGELGTLHWDGIAGSVEFYPKNGLAWENKFQEKSGRNESYLQEWIHLFDCMRTGNMPSPGLVDGIRVLEVVEAIRESSSKGIKLPITKVQL